MAPVTLLVPAYQYPTVGGFWPGLEAASPPVKYLVANPASGPGGSANPDYTTAIGAATAAGITVLGYVNTGDGAVSMATVSAQVGLWQSLYGVTSIVFDNAATSPTQLPYYATASALVHATGGATAVLNHGAIPDPGYAAFGDILVVFENAESAWSAFTPPPWFSSYPASTFAIFAYSIPDQATMSTVMTQAQSYGIGQLYLTDEGGGNPYDTLPAWWAAEVAQALATFSSGGAVTATFHGSAARGYLQYTDTGTGQTLVAHPGGTYTITVASGQSGVPANPPADGFWSVAGS